MTEQVSETEECPICKGAGFIHPLLPSGHPDFTRLIPCQCTGREPEEERLLRLRRDSGDLELGLLRNMTFENFDPRRVNLPVEQQQSLGDACKLARRFAEEPEGWLVFQGPTGCGKTRFVEYMAYKLGRALTVFRSKTKDAPCTSEAAGMAA